MTSYADSIKPAASSLTINEVPYDILREIFVHCLPQYPLDIPQPDTSVAPMLLCQICSSWRMIALASPTLWSHLSCCLTAKYVHSKPTFWTFLPREIEFILWWKKNQGPIAPFLHLDMTNSSKAPISFHEPKPKDVNQDLSLARDGLAMLLKYVTSAQYLNVDSLFWVGEMPEDENEIGDEIVFSHLHTLVALGTCHTTKEFIARALSRTHAPLRRLADSNGRLVQRTIIKSHWLALTHLSINSMFSPLKNFWVSLVQGVPHLQWAYFVFVDVFIENHTEPPAKYTLPQLSTLFVAYSGRHIQSVFLTPALPLTSIFSTLHLPALRTLSLSSRVASWRDHHAISELYTALHSAPALTTLTLRGRGFLSLDAEDHPTTITTDDYPTTLAKIGAIEPIWDHVPHLTHLQIELPEVDGYARVYDRRGKDQVLDTFIRNIFLSNRSWLALDDVVCPIKSVTLIAAFMPFNPLFEEVRDLTMSSIQKYAGGVSNIIFKIICKSEDDTGEEGWKEWGSRDP